MKREYSKTPNGALERWSAEDKWLNNCMLVSYCPFEQLFKCRIVAMSQIRFCFLSPCCRVAIMR